MYKTKIQLEDLHKNLIKWLNNCENSSSERKWKEEAEEDYAFYAGDQDTPEVKAELERQRRPTTTFNEIKPKIDMLVGMGAQMEGATTLMPRSINDAAFLEIVDSARQYYMERTRLLRKQTKVFEHTVKSGISWLHFYVDLNDKDCPLKAQRIPARLIHRDPDSIEEDLSDCRYLFRDKWLDASAIENAFPKFKFAKDSNGLPINEIVDSVSGIDSSLPIFFNEANDKHRLVECWWKIFETKYIFLNPLTHKEEELFEEEFNNFKQMLKKGIDLPNGNSVQKDSLDAVPVRLETMWTAIIGGTDILSIGRNPFKHGLFPYVPCTAYHDENNNVYFSAIKNMKDPQRGFNTTRRQLIHLLQVSPKGLLTEEDGTIINEEEYKEDGAKPNFILKVVRGGLNKITFSKQPQISSIYSELDRLFQQSMKDSSGIQDSLMGIQTGTREPGVTAKHRFETGVAVLHTLFDNFKEFKYICTKIFLSNLQQFVTTEQVIRIKGPEGYNLIEINSKSGENKGINDINAGSFDIIVDEDIVTKTTRLAVAELLTNFSQNNPGSIPPDMIMEYSNAPYSVVTRIRQYDMQKQDMEQSKINIEEQRVDKELELHEREVVVKETEVKIKQNLTKGE